MSNQIDVNQLSNALQQKVDLPSGKSQADIDYVVEWQTPTAENNYTWYRLYKSGWVEQGGLTNSNSTYILPIEMADTNYNVMGSWNGGKADVFYPRDYTCYPISTKEIYVNSNNNGNVKSYCWEVKGMSAQN